MSRADDPVEDHWLFKGLTRPKLINIMGWEITYHSRTVVIVATGFSAVASLPLGFYAILPPLVIGCSLSAFFVWLCKLEPRWWEFGRLWLRTRGQAVLGGSFGLWRAATFSPLPADFPDSRGRRRRIRNLLLRLPR